MIKKRLFYIFLVLASSLFLFGSSNGKVTAQAPQPPTPQPDSTGNLAFLKARLALREGGGLPIDSAQNILALSEPSTPQVPDSIADWVKLAYQAYLDGNFEIVVARGDGSEPERLTYDPSNDGRPRLNLGATQVVFTSDRDGDFEVYSMDVDGTNLRQLTFNHSTDARPAWSPDSSKIVYASDQSGHYEIYIMNADGTGQTQLTFTSGEDCLYPAFSPDGASIAFVMWEKSGYGTVFQISTAGGQPVQVGVSTLFYPGDTAWSPDGQFIAIDAVNKFTYFNEDIHVIDILGNRDYTLSIQKQAQYEDHLLGGWSPDSTRLLFNRIKYGFNGEEFYITDGMMEAQCFGIAGCQKPNQYLAGTGMDFLPDWQNMDLVDPITVMDPVPVYTPADGIVLRWNLLDNGIAPIAGYNLEFQSNQGEVWNWYGEAGKLSNDAYFEAGTPGDSLAIRLQAYDEAGNVEPWPVDPPWDIQTTLYASRLKGKVTDARDRPIPGAAIAIDPAPVHLQPSDPYGDYQSWLSTKDVYTIHAQAAGYGALADTRRDPRSDLVQDLVFPPTNDLLQNGDFELGSFQSWEHTQPPTSTLGLQVTVVTDTIHTGAWAARLGSVCQEPCFDSKGEIYFPSSSGLINQPAGNESHTEIATDGSGTVYVLTRKYDPPGLYAFTRSPAGVWSLPVQFNEEFPSSPYPTYLRVTKAGEALAVWFSDSGYHYAIKKPGQNWGSSLDLNLDPDLIVLKDVIQDTAGRQYILYTDFYPGTTLSFIYRDPGGSWQPPEIAVEPIFFGSRIDAATMAVTSDHVLHFFWTVHESSGDNLFYKQKIPDGSFREKLQLEQNGVISRYGQMMALVDEQGGIHLLYQNDPYAYHRYRDPQGNWSPREILRENVMPEVARVYNGVISAYAGDVFERLIPGQGWDFSPGAGFMSNAFTIDNQGLFHTADDSLYAAQQLAPEQAQASIWQQVAIPANMNKPTLSFLAQLRGGPLGSHTYYQVTVDDGLSVTPVYTGTALNTWEHGWVSMDSWAGQTVTIAFNLHQGAGEPLNALYLDDLSLGAWLTPQIDQVIPQNIRQPGKITILGENFIQKPGVLVGQTTLPSASVNWVDEHTLEVSLPNNISVGIYDLKVINPGGQAAILPGAFRLGWFLDLPLIVR